jgi:DNA repair protein RadD
MPELRDYQSVTLEKIRNAARRGIKRMMLQMPTGAGKTRLAAEIVNGARKKNKRVLFTVPLISLIDQTVEMFCQEGIEDVGVIQADHRMTDRRQPVQVASIQTLMNRIIPTVDVVIRDEAHRLFKFDLGWMNMPTWADVPFIGMSATPWTKGLGRYYEELIIGTTTSELIINGWLVPYRVFAPTHPDLSKVKLVAGDYQETQLAEVMSRSPLLADAVEMWLRYAEDRPTICFAVDCAHARALCEAFNAGGIPTGYMDAKTPINERTAIGRSVESGELKIVCNVDVMGAGVDWPYVSCISYCRPTHSEIRYVQNVGRGLRIHPGKDDLLILDHSDTTLRLGFVEDIHHKQLNAGKERIILERPKPLPICCKQCSFVSAQRHQTCPNCGFKFERKRNIIQHGEGELVEYTELPQYKGKREAFTTADKRQFMAELLGYCIEKGYSPYWAKHPYVFKFGCGPNGNASVPPLKPSPKMRVWLKHYWMVQRERRKKMQEWKAEHGDKV